MVAAMLHEPIWCITDAEAQSLARSLVTVSRHYNVPNVAPYVVDHVQLLLAVIAIYGTRITALRMKEQQAKARPKVVNPTPNGGTTIFPGGQPNFPQGVADAIQ
jgi:hypothetical protein